MEGEINEEASPLINPHFYSSGFRSRPTAYSLYRRLRYQTYRLMFGYSTWSRTLELVIGSMIFINVLSFILSTEQTLADNPKASFIFDTIETCTVSVFTVEYLLRLWCSVENLKKSRNCCCTRLKFFFSPISLIDLVSIIPYYLDLLIFYYERKLRYVFLFRVLRFFRLFKAEKYSHTFSIIGKVIWDSRKVLAAALFLDAVLMVVQATLLYITQRTVDEDAFGSMPRTLWIAMLQLSGMGGFEGYPFTPVGKVISSLAAFSSIALFAIPIATIGNGFLVQWFKMHPNDPAMAYLDVDFESIVQRDDKDEKDDEEDEKEEKEEKKVKEVKEDEEEDKEDKAQQAEDEKTLLSNTINNTNIPPTSPDNHVLVTPSRNIHTPPRIGSINDLSKLIADVARSQTQQKIIIEPIVRRDLNPNHNTASGLYSPDPSSSSSQRHSRSVRVSFPVNNTVHVQCPSCGHHFTTTTSQPGSENRL